MFKTILDFSNNFMNNLSIDTHLLLKTANCNFGKTRQLGKNLLQDSQLTYCKIKRLSSEKKNTSLIRKTEIVLPASR